MNVGFIGTGVISDAIIRGLLAHSGIEGSILVSRRSAHISTALETVSGRIQVFENNQDIIDGSDLVVLAVLPHVAESIISPLTFRTNQDVCSVIATHTFDTLQKWIKTPVRLSRAVPLPSVKDAMGVTVTLNPSEDVQALFSSLGSLIVAHDLDAFDAYASASAMMGTYFGILETTADWMQEQGCSKADAQSYLTQIFAGLSHRAQQETEEDFSQLRVAHSTPGGLNEQLFTEFTTGGGQRAITDALDSVAKRIQNAAKT